MPKQHNPPVNWNKVAHRIIQRSQMTDLNKSQRDSLNFIANAIPKHGVILADEVGMGKTRIACAVMAAVIDCGGTVAAVVPPGLLHQWASEYKRFIASEAGKIYPAQLAEPFPIRSIDGLFEGGLFVGEDDDMKTSYPVANTHRWPLISHRLMAPSIRINSRRRRFDFPALIRFAREDYEDGRTVAGRYYNSNISEVSYDSRTWRKWLAALWISTHLPSTLINKIKNEDLFPNPEWEDSAYKMTQNNKTEDVRNVFEELMGTLIGTVDLMVIDEAHKSRESDSGDPQKLLGRIVKRLVPQAAAGRRLSVTATPIELNATQWHDLLTRTGISASDKTYETIREFTEALNSANQAPDEPERLTRLMEAAKRFESALRPYVTRRRRIHEPEMVEFIDRMNKKGIVPEGSHPHRKYDLKCIRMENLESNWKAAVMALEGQGKAAKGSGNVGGKQVDLRYASGHIAFDLDEEQGAATNKSQSENDSTPSVDDGLEPRVYAKRRRTAYWRRIATSLASSLSDLGLPIMIALVRDISSTKDGSDE